MLVGEGVGMDERSASASSPPIEASPWFPQPDQFARGTYFRPSPYSSSLPCTWVSVLPMDNLRKKSHDAFSVMEMERWVSAADLGLSFVLKPHNSKARSCLLPLQPLSITRRSLDEWPVARTDDVTEWLQPHTLSDRSDFKLDLSSVWPQGNKGQIAHLDKECSKVSDHTYLGVIRLRETVRRSEKRRGESEYHRREN